MSLLFYDYIEQIQIASVFFIKQLSILQRHSPPTTLFIKNSKGIQEVDEFSKELKRRPISEKITERFYSNILTDDST